MATAPTLRAEHFNLYINEPSSLKIVDTSPQIASRRQLLRDVEALLRKALLSLPSMQRELRMLFINTLSTWENVPAESRLRLLHYLKSDPRSKFSQKLMQLVCARKPADVARILSPDDRLFRHFFDHNPERIKAWFAHFSFPGPFEKGALAIERYAMTYRDEFWNRMIWMYSTAPSPVVIAHQKIRFLELDVVRTVEMMAESEPAFWTSEFFRNSLVGGDFLAIDPAYFATELCRRLENGEVWALAESLLRDEPFRELCNRVLLDLDDTNMLHWLYRTVPQATATPEHTLIAEAKWANYDELLVFSAVLTQSKAVMKLLMEERPEDYRALVDFAAMFVPRLEEAKLPDLAAHFAMEREARAESPLAYSKLTTLVMFVLRVALVSFFNDRSALQTIYRQENINAELVFDQPVDGAARDRDQRKRRREPEPIFIGWRFPGSALTYAVRDVCQGYLPELFLRRAAAQFVGK